MDISLLGRDGISIAFIMASFSHSCYDFFG